MFAPEYVLILSGDHIYKMNYDNMLDYHKETGADATIAVIEVPMKEASRFGIMNTDDEGRIVEFEEKPENPKSNLASMGIYIFNWKLLRKMLLADMKNQDSNHDFGKDIIPTMLNDGRKLYAYKFKGYWKDVGTIDSLWEANMDLINSKNELDLNDDSWKIYTEDTTVLPQYVGPTAEILMLFAKLDIVFNVMPAADQDKADDFPALLCGSGGHGCVQLRYQPEDRLDTLVAQGRLTIFDLAVQGIGEHDLQNGMEDVTGAGILHFHHLRYSAHVLILVIAHDRQVIAEYAGKIGENPAFDVSVLQHIGNVACNLHRKFQIPRIQFHIFPEVAFVGGIPGGFQIWGCRIPLEFRQVIHVGLLCQKIGIQYMT